MNQLTKFKPAFSRFLVFLFLVMILGPFAMPAMAVSLSANVSSDRLLQFTSSGHTQVVMTPLSPN
jgi:hypothetical protein